MENFTSAQLAAFILGIIFSVFSVVAVLIAIRKPNKLKMSTGTLLLLMVMPFIAFIAWFYLAFSFIRGFANNEFLTLMIALLSALVICVMIIVVSLALYRRSKKLMTETELAQIIEESADEEEIDDEDEEEVRPQTVLVLPENAEIKITKAENESNANKEEVKAEAPAEEKVEEPAVQAEEPSKAIEETEAPAEELTLEEPPVENVEELEEEATEPAEETEEVEEPAETEEVEEPAEEADLDDLDEADLDKKFDELIEMLKNEPLVSDTEQLDDMADDIIDDFQEDMGKKKSDKKDDE